MTFKAIIPKESKIPDPEKYRARKGVALSQIKKILEKEYSSIDRTFSPENKLDVEGRITGDRDGSRVVVTAKSHFIKFLNNGTGIYGPRKKLIKIRPGKKGFLSFQGRKAKTRPGSLRSRSGGPQGKRVYTRKPVEIKGIRPRLFDENITDKSRGKIQKILSKLIDGTV